MNDEMQKIWLKVVAKAWADEDYKQQLLENPVAVLKNEGIDVDPSFNLVICEDTQNTKHLVLPVATESTSEIEGEERVAAFGACGCGGFCC